MNKNKQRLTTGRMEFGMLYARMPEGGPRSAVARAADQEQPKGARGVDTCLTLNVTSPPPSGRGITGKRTDFLNAMPLPSRSPGEENRYV